MQVLLDSHHEKETRLGIAISIALHAAPVLAALLAGGVAIRSESLADRFVTYFAPPDQHKGANSLQRTAPFHGTPSAEDPGPTRATTEQPTTRATPAVAPADDSTGGGAPVVAEPVPESDPEPVWTELEVDSVVQRHPLSAAPRYPTRLLEDKVEGSVYVSFVVDSTGLALPASFRVIRATHQGFADAVREALPLMRFRPAYLAGHPVRQLVEQPFTFRIRAKADTTAVPKAPPS